ncbi:MAG TPA: glycerophosphodiester phosphodiesterase family protein [Sphingobacterium sp.]|nr:glycerophosphodiester phosphodiesterase family protein [Sphingobacterium sp.]
MSIVRKLTLPIVLISLSAASCKLTKHAVIQNTFFPSFSYEGHRGARGLYPENSIGSMKVAMDMPKVTTLELDCHITKDKKVIVFHDPYINPKFIQYMDGRELKEKDKNANVYNYTWAELAVFDKGSKFYEAYPQQKKVKTPINLLSDLIDSTEAYAKEIGRSPMFYNIETKLKEGQDHVRHPTPQEMSDLILQVILEKGIASRTVIQSFDKRSIQYINKTYPQIKTSYLIGGNNKMTIKELIEDLGFKPFIISPYYKLVDKNFVRDAHKAGLKVIPWTVNTKEEIRMLEVLKVDGIISDYPNLF